MPRTTIANTAAALLAEHRALAPEELGRLIADSATGGGRFPGSCCAE